MPSQAREVLRWREEKPQEARAIWKSLGETNSKIFTALEALSLEAQVLIATY
jgi:hypothetical protein